MFFTVVLAALFCSIVFTFIGVWLGKRFEEGVPGIALFVLFIAQFAVFSVLVTQIGMASGGLLISLGFAIALPPFAVLGSRISQYFGNAATNFVFSGSLTSKAPLAYGKARALLNQGNIEGAIEQFKRYYREDPAVADPLYQAATLLIRLGRAQEAADMYREIMTNFREDIPVWAKAAYELALVLELRLNDPGAAEVLYSQIIVRGRGTEPARLAANRQVARTAPGLDEP